jgi:3-oxo-4-pregnene-20-carboxyl-CoA dehydrogenase beta subunit
MGVDITYPMTRYYSTVKDLTRPLGGPAASSWPGWSVMFVDLTPKHVSCKPNCHNTFRASPASKRPRRCRPTGTAAYRAGIRRISRDGKLGVGWPVEYGGLGFGPIEEQIFVNEVALADVPLLAVTLQTVGPTFQPAAACGVVGAR